MVEEKKDEKDTQPVSVEEEKPAQQTVGEDGVDDKVAELEQALEAARDEASRNWDLYLRERADLENFRKRTQREKEDLARFANEKLLREFLPILDNLERAVSHATEGSENDAGLLEGVELTLGQFHKVLEKFGVAAVEAVGKPFDPTWHEAMGQMESAEHPPNTVVQEMQRGYTLNERLLRPALVMVAKAPPKE